jgi:hypothetical protein
MNMLGLSSSVRIAYTVCYWKLYLFHYEKVLCHGFARQIMPILRTLCYNGSWVTRAVVSLTTAKFKPHISYVWLRLVLYKEYVHSHDFVWLLLVACTILLSNRIHGEGWKPCANHGPVCTLENFQWCGVPSFVGAAILRGRCLLLVPRKGKDRSLLNWSVPYGGLVSCWRSNTHFWIGSKF